jgi:hypothetical protein
VGDENVSDGTLCEVHLDLPPNEASGLLATENDALLGAHAWDCALWTLLGEGEIQDCVAIVGHERGPTWAKVGKQSILMRN